MYDAVKYQMMLFKPIFSPVEHVLYVGWTIYPLVLRKRLRTLKNGFYCFLT